MASWGPSAPWAVPSPGPTDSASEDAPTRPFGHIYCPPSRSHPWPLPPHGRTPRAPLRRKPGAPGRPQASRCLQGWSLQRLCPGHPLPPGPTAHPPLLRGIGAVQVGSRRGEPGLGSGQEAIDRPLTSPATACPPGEAAGQGAWKRLVRALAAGWAVWGPWGSVGWGTSRNGGGRRRWGLSPSLPEPAARGRPPPPAFGRGRGRPELWGRGWGRWPGREPATRVTSFPLRP